MSTSRLVENHNQIPAGAETGTVTRTGRGPGTAGLGLRPGIFLCYTSLPVPIVVDQAEGGCHSESLLAIQIPDVAWSPPRSEIDIETVLAPGPLKLHSPDETRRDFIDASVHLVRLFLLQVPILPVQIVLPRRDESIKLRFSTTAGLVGAFFCASFSFVFAWDWVGSSVRIGEGWSGCFNFGIRASFSAIASLPVQIVQTRLGLSIEGDVIDIKPWPGDSQSPPSWDVRLRRFSTANATANETSLLFGGLHDNIAFCSAMIRYKRWRFYRLIHALCQESTYTSAARNAK
ncbi:hypothetical protein P692DRAFT_201855685 [Suillus brevipes Sb2]|nr:hypothetical protein P692DRAFT_201855685 [Suillus brevipes Sb2]